MFEVNYELIGVHKIRRLLPTGSRQDHVEGVVKSEFGIGINCISVNEAFCVTGSDDGYLRLWPLDFSGVVLEAGRFSTGVSCFGSGTCYVASTVRCISAFHLDTVWSCEDSRYEETRVPKMRCLSTPFTCK